MDIASYANTLPEKEKKWLASFTEEYVNANFNHSGKKLHKTKKLKKSVYDRNNARNRCVFTKNKAQGQLVNIDVVFKELKKKEEKDDIIVPVKKTKLLK